MIGIFLFSNFPLPILPFQDQRLSQKRVPDHNAVPWYSYFTTVARDVSHITTDHLLGSTLAACIAPKRNKNNTDSITHRSTVGGSSQGSGCCRRKILVQLIQFSIHSRAFSGRWDSLHSEARNNTIGTDTLNLLSALVLPRRNQHTSKTIPLTVYSF